MDIDGPAFVLCTLAVWRIAHLLALEDGPFDLVFKLRRAVGQGFFGSLLDCFLCLSLWVAAPFALLVSTGWIGRVVSWLALSGSASVLFLLTDRRTEK
jgi:Protein of unknown function (DUF1360)